MQISDIGPFFGGLVSLVLAAAVPLIRWIKVRRQIVLITGKEYPFEAPTNFKELQNDWSDSGVNRMLSDPLREDIIRISKTNTVMSIVIKNNTSNNLDNCVLSLGSSGSISYVEMSSRGATKAIANPSGPIGMGSIQPRQEVSVVVWTRSLIGGLVYDQIVFHCDRDVKTVVRVRWEGADKYYHIVYLNKESVKFVIFQIQLLLGGFAVLFFATLLFRIVSQH